MRRRSPALDFAPVPVARLARPAMARSLKLVPLLGICASLLAAPAAHARGDFVGMTSDDVFAKGGSYRQKNMATMRKAGVGLLRQTFDWSRIEYAQGQYDWSVYDQYVAAAARNHLRILAVLFNAPDFYSTKPSHGAKRGFYPPRDPNSMGGFAAAVLNRYGSNGSFWREHPGSPKVPIHSIQVWNEPAIRLYWLPKQSAKGYVRLLKAVRKAAKQADPHVEVVTAGLPNSFLRSAIRLYKYMAQMYKAGAKGSFDTLAVNSYARDSTELKSVLKKVRAVMRRHHDRHKLWITEIGWCDHGVRHRFCVGITKVKRNISNSLKVIKRGKRAFRLRGFVYYSWRDARPYAGIGDQWGLHTGLLNLKGKKKSSFNVFSRTARRLF